MPDNEPTLRCDLTLTTTTTTTTTWSQSSHNEVTKQSHLSTQSSHKAVTMSESQSSHNRLVRRYPQK